MTVHFVENIVYMNFTFMGQQEYKCSKRFAQLAGFQAYLANLANRPFNKNRSGRFKTYLGVYIGQKTWVSQAKRSDTFLVFLVKRVDYFEWSLFCHKKHSMFSFLRCVTSRSHFPKLLALFMTSFEQILLGLLWAFNVAKTRSHTCSSAYKVKLGPPCFHSSNERENFTQFSELQ